MPRTISSRIPIALSAHEAWRLRCSFELEQHIAHAGNRKLTLVSEDVSSPGTDCEQHQRQARCELLGDHLGGSIMGVKTSDLTSNIASTCYVRRHGEEHGSEFWVTLPFKKVRVTIEGQQWCLPSSDASCFLCTRVEVEARMMGIGNLIEMHLERHIRASHAAFPQYALEFLKREEQEREAQPQPQQPALPVHLSEIEPVVTADPLGHIDTSGEQIQLNRCHLLAALLINGARRLRRRHRALSSKDCHARDQVPVRLHRQHARVLLLFGCASAVVDSDEIVE
tara:strand:- start:41 stop:886 length:846 start_codon:yes stop_codon:yes gene_type:complete